MGLLHHKIPVEVLQLGTDAVAIDERIAPEPGEHVIVQETRERVLRHAPGEHAARRRRRHGDHHGVTMAGCVRHTTEDAIGYGFRPIGVRECVGDRARAWSSGTCSTSTRSSADVEPLETVLGYLAAVSPFTSAVTV